MTDPTTETARALPADWSPAVRDALWTAVNAPTYDESAAATLAFAQLLAVPAAVPPVDRAALRDRIAASMREHYLSTNRDEADADGNLPCRCGDWREPGAEVDDENDWDAHLADAVLAVLPEPADRAAVLLEAAEAVIKWSGQQIGVHVPTVDAIAAELRRLAGETPATGSAIDLPAVADALDGLHTLIATSSRDWQTYRVDAWLWAVLCGWDCEQAEHDETCTHGALEETAAMHGWDADTVAKARRYRAAVRALTDTAAGARQDGARPKCGAWGGCPLSVGHNRGRADIPENHHGLNADLFTGPQWETRDPEAEERERDIQRDSQ